MRKYPLGLMLALVFPCFTIAQNDPDLLVYEAFDYAVFNPIWCLNTEGVGWTGPWERVVGDDAVIRADNLSLPASETGVAPGNHCAVEFIRAGMRYDRPIAPIEDDGQTVWISVLMNFRPGAHPNNVGNITLLKNGQQVFTFGRKYGSQLFGVVFAPNVTSYNTNINTQGRHWLVVKIQFSGDNGTDNAWFWVDPPLNTEPDVSTADLAIPQNGMPNITLNNGFDGIQLKAEGTPPLLLAYDELRVGNTFTSINPFLVVNTEQRPFDPQLTLFPNPASGSFNYRFSLPETDRLKIALYDLQGRLVYRETARDYPQGTHHNQLDLAALHLPAGIYLLRLVGTSGSVTERVVVE